jgi:ketosteroid isomerase-like protein
MLEGLVQRQFETLNRRDLNGIMATFRDDAVFEFPGRSTVSGRFVGKDAIRAWWRRWVEHYASVHFTVRHVGIVSLRPGANVLLVAWDVDVTTVDGIRGQTSGVSLLRQRGGKIALSRDYFFDPEILDAFWGRAADQPVREAVAMPELVPAGS